VRIVRSKAFGKNVIDTGSLKNSSGGATGNNTGTCGSRFHEKFTSAKLAFDFERNCLILIDRYLYQVFLGLLNALPDSLRNFVCFAKTITDMATAITYYNKCGETEPTATLDNLGYAAYVNDTIIKVKFCWINPTQRKPPRTLRSTTRLRGLLQQAL